MQPHRNTIACDVKDVLSFTNRKSAWKEGNSGWFFSSVIMDFAFISDPVAVGPSLCMFVFQRLILTGRLIYY